MTKYFRIGIVIFATIINCNSPAYGMSQALKIFSWTKSNITSIFTGGSSSYSRCLSCDSVYNGRTPNPNDGLPMWQYHEKGSEWTRITLEAIDREGLADLQPNDATSYCPNWNNLNLAERRSFWLNFASKIAEKESGLNPKTSYYESEGAARGTYSNGLFQMSVGDSCGLLKTTADTFDEEKNIRCAIKTMRSLVGKTGYIGTGENKGMGKYWQVIIDNATFRPEQTARVKRNILTYTQNLPYCRVGYQREAKPKEATPTADLKK